MPTCRSHSVVPRFILALALLGPAPVRADPGTPPHNLPGPRGEETVQQALCRLITTAATNQKIPVAFLTRLIWQESNFRAGVTSPAGAQGIAQFMPGTAQERGLDDPFDPEKAVPASAALLRDLATRFGNLGLAAAAYNGGPNRVAAWLHGTGGLPAETEDYVLRVTGRSADDWAADAKTKVATEIKGDSQTCLALASTLRTAALARGSASPEAPFAPWGVQLAGNFSKSLALASFSRARTSYAAILGDARPMIIGTRLRSRGFHAFYRVRVPAQTRQAAEILCKRIKSAQGSCVVLRS